MSFWSVFFDGLLYAMAVFGFAGMARCGWSITGHLLFRAGIRDVCGQTTIHNHSNAALVVNGEERKP